MLDLPSLLCDRYFNIVFTSAGQQSQTLTLPSQSPSESPTKSAQSSPTITNKHVRPRAKSVETDPGKRIVRYQIVHILQKKFLFYSYKTVSDKDILSLSDHMMANAIGI